MPQNRLLHGHGRSTLVSCSSNIVVPANESTGQRCGFMKIAQVSPLFEAVPPAAYGGTERVISYLTEELVRQGHDVTLFATGDSITARRSGAGLRSQPACGCSHARRIKLAGVPHHRTGYGRGVGGQLRRDPFSYRFPAFSDGNAADDAPHHDPARQAGPAGAAAPLPLLPRHSAGIHFKQPASSLAMGELAGDGLPRPACRPPCIRAGSRGLFFVHRTHFPREAGG